MAPQLIIDARASGTIQESEPVLKATCVSGDAHAESKGVNATSKTVYAIKDPASDLSTKTVAESVYKLEKERADKLSDQVQKLEMTLNAACVTETLLLYAWKCEKKRANEQEKRADMEAERAKKETIRACSEKTATVNSKASLDETIKRVEALQTTLSETRDSETSLRSAWQTEILQTKEEQTRADELEKHAQKLTVQIQELEQRLSDAHANEAVIGHNCEQMRNRIDELMLRGNEAVIHAENETRRAQELSNNVQLLEKSLSEAQMSEAAVRHDCEQMRKKLDELVVNYNNLDTHAQNETKRANYLNDCACREQKIAKFHAQRADNEARRADDEKRRADAEEMCANKQADLVQYQMMVADLHNERAHIANTNANEQTERAKMVVTQAQENEANLINKYSRVKSHADWATDRVQELEDNLRTGNVANVDSHPQTYDYANETARKRRMVSESRPCKTAKSVAANVRIVAPGENDVASASQF
ncbi:hypothetical protein IW150_005408 [Coemansia sp. RSA 2607]|nr:hypothetical protein IW150_005408 [Coemansia sp. RSA 2607]KAJ2390854.1 hypothetical protein GGI05_003111 [Coemansia sp. RSA 2603]